MDLSMLAYWTIRQRLLRVPGVANIAIWGEQLEDAPGHGRPEADGRARRHARPGAWRRLRMPSTLACCSYASGAHIGTGGFVETPNQRLHSGFVAAGVTPEDAGQGAGDQTGGRQAAPLERRGRRSYATPARMIGDAVINDGPGLMLIVEKLPWGNTLDVTRGVEAALERDAARPAGHRDRHDDLPAGDLHRGLDRQPEPRTDPRLRPGRRWCSSLSSTSGAPR